LWAQKRPDQQYRRKHTNRKRAQSPRTSQLAKDRKLDLRDALTAEAV